MDWALFAGLTERQTQDVLAATRRRTFTRGEVVFHRGDPADTLHLIRKGRFAARVVTPTGDEAILSVLSRGEFFGELALLLDVPRSATVTALEAGETLSLHKLDFERAKRTDPSVNDVVQTALVTRVLRLSVQLVEALYLPVEQRVTRRVHELALVYAANGPETEIPLNQQDLAGLSGTSRATVNKVLRALEQRGVVTLRRGCTVVLDVDALAAAAR